MTDVKTIDTELLGTISNQAKARERRRQNHNFHPQPEDPVQRFLNAIEPGSYVRPHRHTNPARWETFVILAGRALVLTFAPDGEVLGRYELSAGGPLHAVELPAGGWHTIAALLPGTVVLEFKPGPYLPIPAQDFAAWAPAEQEEGWETMLRWVMAAQPGDRPPAR